MATYPQDGPTSFEALLEPLPADVRDVATRLRELIQATIPDADESVSGGAKMGIALYSIGGANNVVCGIQPTEDTCRLFFHGWKQLEDGGYRLDGSGKNARHIKIRSPEELDLDDVEKMIEIAAEAR
ncbi:DUF1801 domain-containing protein [Salinarchaeum laminariae]|uniref:DUF1801 domain-containing protein n=1 Tax=Salinarchaeum laminariae TaxID=869888 RepID=UPI0020BE850A|nr:DUF1801 domain-containing protein [Salinarchaeum laminariae]